MTAVAIAYGFIWAAVFGYLIVLGSKLAKVQVETDELQRKLKELQK